MTSKTIKKVKDRIWGKIVAFSRTKTWYFKIYSSYWHYRLFSKNRQCEHENYYSAIPNVGSGIGHQMANWIAGYWFATLFELKFAHSPFSSEQWEAFLGFGVKEQSVDGLLINGYRKVKLPLFHELNLADIALTKKIIESYKGDKVLFFAEQDQNYRDQFGVIELLKNKYYSAPARKNDELIFSKDHLNIAIHVRRGDIVIGQETQNPNLLLRWLDNDYFEKVLSTIVENINSPKKVVIYFFSQGVASDFESFGNFKNINFCLDMNAQDSFLHMVNADILITSKSSFSYKPALLCNGIKVCPKNFWHGYPNSDDWILVDDHGTFNIDELKSVENKL
jgi:hypothetical protein